MGSWIFMFVMTLLIPFSFLAMWYLCPKFQEINSISGYRTSRSMKNKVNWVFAQNVCSKLALKFFFQTLALALIIMPFFINHRTDTIEWIGLAIVILQGLDFPLLIILTEKALKEFDNIDNID